MQNSQEPTKSPELYIMDIGHGNLGILLDTRVTLLDCGPIPSSKGKILSQMLEALDVKKIDNVLLSHPDADHLGGLPYLIENFPIERILLNPDASKSSELWYEGIELLESAEQLGTEVHVGLTTRYSRKIPSGEVEIEILAPSLSLALTGVGGKYLGEHLLKSNTLSVVVRLIHRDCPVVLLPGDLDAFGLAHLIERQENLRAKILVFPHHGGSSGGDDYAFASQLGDLVQPEIVLFSLHRNRHGNPREQIITGLRAACPNARIMCTQLSEQCAPMLPASSPSHLTVLPALGKSKRSCCGGSICIQFNGAQTRLWPDPGAHRIFVESLAQPLCLRQLMPQPVSSHVLSRP